MGILRNGHKPDGSNSHGGGRPIEKLKVSTREERCIVY